MKTKKIKRPVKESCPYSWLDDTWVNLYVKKLEVGEMYSTAELLRSSEVLSDCFPIVFKGDVFCPTPIVEVWKLCME